MKIIIKLKVNNGKRFSDALKIYVDIAYIKSV